METSGGKIYVYRSETQDKHCPVHGCQKDRTKQVRSIVQYTAVRRTGLSRYGMFFVQYLALTTTGLTRYRTVTVQYTAVRRTGLSR
jgi:hypothetical protein